MKFTILDSNNMRYAEGEIAGPVTETKIQEIIDAVKGTNPNFSVTFNGPNADGAALAEAMAATGAVIRVDGQRGDLNSSVRSGSSITVSREHKGAR